MFAHYITLSSYMYYIIKYCKHDPFVLFFISKYEVRICLRLALGHLIQQDQEALSILCIENCDLKICG